MTKKDLDYLKFLKTKIVDNHKQCKGLGFYKKDDCDCMQAFRWLKELYKSKIPKEFWHVNYDLVLKDEIKKYFSNFEENYINGRGFFIYGDYSVGKTTTLCEIGKRFMTRGKKVVYFLLSNYVNALYNEMSNEPDDSTAMYLYMIKNADVLLVDEFDKVYIKKGSDFVLREVETFLRNKFMNNCPIFVCSNSDMQTGEDIFGDFSIVSIMNRNLKEIDHGDESLSHKNEEVQIDDYMKSNHIIKYASIYHKYYQTLYE